MVYLLGDGTSKIQEQVEITWRHVPSDHNVADAASRLIDPHALKGHSLWWPRPQWLVTNKFLEHRQFCDTKTSGNAQITR